MMLYTELMSGANGRSLCDFGGDGADGLVSVFASKRSGLQRGKQVDALAGAEQFDGKDVAEIFEACVPGGGRRSCPWRRNLPDCLKWRSNRQNGE